MYRALTTVLIMVLVTMIVVGCGDTSQTTISVPVPDSSTSTLRSTTTSLVVPETITTTSLIVPETATTTLVVVPKTSTTIPTVVVTTTVKPVENWSAKIENPKHFPAISWFGDGYVSELWAWIYNVEGELWVMGYEWYHEGLHFTLGDTTDFSNEDPDEEYIVDGVVVFDHDNGFGLQVQGNRPVVELEQAGYDVFGQLIFSRHYVFADVSVTEIPAPNMGETYLLHLVPIANGFKAVGYEKY